MKGFLPSNIVKPAYYFASTLPAEFFSESGLASNVFRYNCKNEILLFSSPSPS